MRKNNKKASQIVKSINESNFTASECEDIFNALLSQNNVLGGKFWTIDDIRSRIDEIYKVNISDKIVEQIACDITNYANLDQRTFLDWNAIDSVIRDEGIIIRVTDIIWDIDKADLEEAEYQSVKEMLPVTVDIPLSELEYKVDVIDYLSDKYGYCVSACCIKERDNDVIQVKSPMCR